MLWDLARAGQVENKLQYINTGQAGVTLKIWNIFAPIYPHFQTD